MSTDTLRMTYIAVLHDILPSLRAAPAVSISFDGWDNGSIHRSLIGINYHWLDDQWQYHSSTLDVITVLAAHTGLFTYASLLY